MGTFSITPSDFSWLGGVRDDPEDLCLHGHAAARIGAVTLEYDCTLSAAALYLLKTLTEDHIIHEDNQLLPCCGFFLVADKAEENVTIIGCDNGVDWTVRHEGGNVRLILEDGTEEVVPLSDYRAAVCRFADEVETYYKACSPKKIPEDAFERTGYLTFWKEWHRRRNAWAKETT